MGIATPPRRPPVERDRDLERRVADLEALIEEARRCARRRRRRNLVGILSALLGALLLYSFVGIARTGGRAVVDPRTSHPSVGHPKSALPEELSFNANGGVVLIGRDGRLRPFVSGIFHLPGKRYPRTYGAVDWSPDGSQLLAKRSGGELVVIDDTGKIVSAVHSTALDGRWSPDGTRIAFLRHEGGLGRVLLVASSDGRVRTRIAAHVQVGYAAFSWSPDGAKLAYGVEGAPGLMIADATGRRAPRRIPTTATDSVSVVRWSPDGSRIAFGGSHINVVRPDGTLLHRVADGCAFDWAPDGKRLAILAAAGSGPVCGDVSVVNADGTDLHRIARCSCVLRAREGFLFSLAWSHDGTRIAYTSGRGDTLSTIRPDGSGATIVATKTGRGRDPYRYPSLPLWRTDAGALKHSDRGWCEGTESGRGAV